MSIKLKKGIAIILISAFLLIQSFNIASVRAYDGTAGGLISAAATAAQWVAEQVYNTLVDRMKVRIAQLIIDKVISAVNDQYSKLYVGNWVDWLRKNKISVGLDWPNDLFGVDLCSTINPRLKFYLQGKAKIGQQPKAECTLDKMLDSWNDTVDYLASGNWVVMEEITDPNSNNYGKHINATAGLSAVQKNVQEINILEADSTKGWLSVEKCVHYDDNGECDQTTVVTPGDLVQATVQKVHEIPYDLLVNAESLLEAIIQGLAITYVDSIFDGLFYNEYTTGDEMWDDVKGSAEESWEDQEWVIWGGGVQCGNGTLETGEECDDGNTVSGDGCSATCTNE